MEDTGKTQLFENTKIPKAVMTLAIPTVISSLVMVIYNLADTYFVGMLNDPVETAAVTLAAPVLLAFNAVNNLFGVGTSTMMSRAMGIAQKINMIPMYIALGLGQGVMPLISYNFASGNISRMKKTYKFALAVSVSFLTAIAAVYFIFPGKIAALFIDNNAVVIYAAVFLKGMCLAIPFLAIDFLAVGVFQACAMGKEALIFAVLRKIVPEIPALIILNKLFSVYGLAYAQLCAELVLSAAAAVVMIRLFKKLSKKNRE